MIYLSRASSSDSESSNNIDRTKCVNVMFKECDGVQGVLYDSHDAENPDEERWTPAVARRRQKRRSASLQQ